VSNSFRSVQSLNSNIFNQWYNNRCYHMNVENFLSYTSHNTNISEINDVIVKTRYINIEPNITKKNPELQWHYRLMITCFLFCRVNTIKTIFINTGCRLLDCYRTSYNILLCTRIYIYIYIYTFIIFNIESRFVFWLCPNNIKKWHRLMTLLVLPMNIEK